MYEGPGTSAVLLQYGYDAAARPYFLSRISGLNTVYYYDALQRLAALSHDFAGTASDVTYAMTDYNPAGQLTIRTRDNAAYAWNGYTDVSRAYAVNGLNQYTSSGARRSRATRTAICGRAAGRITSTTSRTGW